MNKTIRRELWVVVMASALIAGILGGIQIRKLIYIPPNQPLRMHIEIIRPPNAPVHR